jgi:hypothetical protein
MRVACACALILPLLGCKEEARPYVSATNFKPIGFTVEADPGVEYIVFDVIKRPDGLIEVFSRRNGKSGISYAKRLVDCNNWTFKYLADADTIEDLANENPMEKMAELTFGSSSTVVSYYGCTAVGLGKV